jgi:hypothetical protein
MSTQATVGPQTPDQSDTQNEVKVIPIISSAGNSGRSATGKFVRGNPWKMRPGETRNPSGRRKQWPLSAALEIDLGKRLPDTEEGAAIRQRLGLGHRTTWARAIAAALIRQAISGDVAAAREIADRIEGKATQRHEITGFQGGDVHFHVTYEASEHKD